MLAFILITLGIEIFTLSMRLLWHSRSAKFQHKIGWPRVHHSYIGISFLALSFVFQYENTSGSYWLLMLGLALIASDLLHHLIFLPIVHKYGYDVTLIHHAVAHRCLEFAIGSLALVTGIIAFFTPLDSGYWLIPLGLVMTVGRQKTAIVLSDITGRGLYRKLRLAHFMEKNYGRDDWKI